MTFAMLYLQYYLESFSKTYYYIIYTNTHIHVIISHMPAKSNYIHTCIPIYQ